EQVIRRGITMFLSRSSLPYATLFLLGFSAQAVTAPTSLASIYSYTDEAGVRSFTNQLNAVPEKYRSRMTALDLDLPPTIPEVPPPATADAPMHAADVRTVSASGEYHMGNHDTRADGVRLAVEAAKRDALEQVATYLESVTEVRDLNVTRDDIRSYTAGIVKVLEETITTRIENESIVIRADLTAEIDPHEVAQAIAALRENDSAASELMALRAETDRLQEQLDATNHALAAAPSPDEVQQLSRERDEMLNDLQATALVSQAWTSWAYPTLGLYSYPWMAGPGINGLLLQAQRLSPRHRHLARGQQSITAQTGTMPTLPPHASGLASRRSLLVPSSSFMHSRQAPPLLNQQGLPAKVGDIVTIPSPQAVPPVIHHTSPQPQPYQVHPNHFWRPSPPNIQTSPSIPQQRPSVSSRPSGSYAGHRGGGGHSHGNGGGRGR
ncbi:MAG: hypothetical protein KAY09_03530, partial [Nitrospira sp.]|nr:hypothetical protein [Nitrospira sp.]